VHFGRHSADLRVRLGHRPVAGIGVQRAAAVALQIRGFPRLEHRSELQVPVTEIDLGATDPRRPVRAQRRQDVMLGRRETLVDLRGERRFFLFELCPGDHGAEYGSRHRQIRFAESPATRDTDGPATVTVRESPSAPAAVSRSCRPETSTTLRDGIRCPSCPICTFRSPTPPEWSTHFCRSGRWRSSGWPRLAPQLTLARSWHSPCRRCWPAQRLPDFTQGVMHVATPRPRPVSATAWGRLPRSGPAAQRRSPAAAAGLRPAAGPARWLRPATGPAARLPTVRWFPRR